MKKKCIAIGMGALLAIIAPGLVQAEMTTVDDATLAGISGQGGIYLSGDISINQLGGPVEDSYFGSCEELAKKCGARFAYQLKENGGGWCSTKYAETLHLKV